MGELQGVSPDSISEKDERWTFQVGAGKRRHTLQQGFATKREAEKALAAAQQSVKHGTVVSKSTIEVQAFHAVGP